MGARRIQRAMKAQIAPPKVAVEARPCAWAGRATSRGERSRAAGLAPSAERCERPVARFGLDPPDILLLLAEALLRIEAALRVVDRRGGGAVRGAVAAVALQVMGVVEVAGLVGEGLARLPARLAAHV